MSFTPLTIKKYGDVDIHIYNTYDHPLFLLDDMKLLFENINLDGFRIEDFDTEIFQDTSLLTETGVREFLYKVPKHAVVSDIRKWFYNTVKHLNVDRAYYEVDKPFFIYVMSTDKLGVYKCGRTKTNVIRRKNELQTACVDPIQILFTYSTHDDVLLELIVHKVLDRYRLTTREHFQCSLNYIKMIIVSCGRQIEVCSSSRDNISHTEFITQLHLDFIPSQSIIKQDIMQDRQYIPKKSLKIPKHRIQEFMNSYIIFTSNDADRIVRSRLVDRYLQYIGKSLSKAARGVLNTFFDSRMTIVRSDGKICYKNVKFAIDHSKTKYISENLRSTEWIIQ